MIPGRPLARCAALLCAGAALVAASPPKQDCSGDPAVAAAAAAWRAGTAQPPLAINRDKAICFRNALLGKLKLGPVVGYKVGVYTSAARASYGTDRPVAGILLRSMIREPGQPMSVRFAVYPMAEADLLLVVRDEGINQARTREEAYAHIRGYRPFIELPDNNYPADLKPDLARVVALDVNARRGVAGPEIALPPTPEGMKALAELSVTTLIQRPDGTSEAGAKIADTLGDPLQILLDARDLLRSEGIRLKAGDIVSLGTITPPHAPVAGEVFTVRYKVGGTETPLEQAFTP